MVYKFFNKNSKGSSVVNNEIKQNLQLAKELRKPTIRNLKKKSSLFEISRQYLGCRYAITKQI